MKNFFVILFIVFSVQSAQAKLFDFAKIKITSESAKMETEETIFKGSVIASNNGHAVKCGILKIFGGGKKILAQENVFLTDDLDQSASAGEIEYNQNTKTTTLRNKPSVRMKDIWVDSLSDSTTITVREKQSGKVFVKVSGRSKITVFKI